MFGRSSSSSEPRGRVTPTPSPANQTAVPKERTGEQVQRADEGDETSLLDPSLGNPTKKKQPKQSRDSSSLMG